MVNGVTYFCVYIQEQGPGSRAPAWTKHLFSQMLYDSLQNYFLAREIISCTIIRYFFKMILRFWTYPCPPAPTFGLISFYIPSEKLKSLSTYNLLPPE